MRTAATPLPFTGAWHGLVAWLCARFSALGACCACLVCLCSTQALHAQGQVRGQLQDEESAVPLVGARVIIEGKPVGGLTDSEGKFEFRAPDAPPFSLLITYFGYDTLRVEVTEFEKPLKLLMTPSALSLDEVVITSTREERNRQASLTVESMSITGIKETPAISFYDGLGSLKGVDLTAASIGFKVVNTRGFNSTSPVRSLQIIDGVDNQAPGLNFSLGNFLGASELDVESVDLIVGASSAFYGPSAFNGVISMNTKSPFVHQGLSVMAKAGERNLGELALRYARAFTNKQGEEKFAFKFNVYYLQADDWEADNLAEVDLADSLKVGEDNPGGYDAVNRYGDENLNPGPRTYTDLKNKIDYPGLGTFHRTGYEERDLVDYDTRNLKVAAALHYKLKPDVELIYSGNFGTGTTVYQGDNRYSLKNILFLQNRLEIQKPGKFFVRAYATHEDAGDSYDAVFTAFRLQENRKSEVDFTRDYRDYWRNEIVPRIKAWEGFPEPSLVRNPDGTFTFQYDEALADQILAQNQDLLTQWHAETRAVADEFYLQPGTPEFERLFNDITSRSITEGRGTRLIDRSALYHLHGEYRFTPAFGEIVVGGNARLYTPISEGTIFSDTLRITTREEGGQIRRDSVRTTITNREFGLYAGLEKQLLSETLRFNATIRIDKNENFDFVASPAVSMVYNINSTDILRASFSAAVRNPTLQDQYLYYNVGRALLLGNLNGFDSLVTTESFINFSNQGQPDRSLLDYFNVDPIQPEKVRTLELGYRATWFDRLYVDASYYYSFYRDFIGFNIGLETTFQPGSALPQVQAYRVAANATDRVTTQGFSVGLNYFLDNGYTFNGNYSWNVLNTESDDPIIPAFNTPEHKFNIGFSGRNVTWFGIRHLGFNINYKWVDGFVFEGSPQFTGFVPSYDLLDVQINKYFPDIKTTFKLGASNLLNNRQFQVYGGPRIGRMVYLSAVLEVPEW